MTSPLPWKFGNTREGEKIILSANEKYVCSVQIRRSPNDKL